MYEERPQSNFFSLNLDFKREETPKILTLPPMPYIVLRLWKTPETMT